MYELWRCTAFLFSFCSLYAHSCPGIKLYKGNENIGRYRRWNEIYLFVCSFYACMLYKYIVEIPKKEYDFSSVLLPQRGLFELQIRFLRSTNFNHYKSITCKLYIASIFIYYPVKFDHIVLVPNLYCRSSV